MTTDTVSIEQMVRINLITMATEQTDSNPSMPDAENMDHWKCVLRRPGHNMTVYFSMGYGHNGKKPTAADVLDCLASDASTIENTRGFEDWCLDLGYDTDSRKAEKTFKTCEHQSKQLRSFMGEHYENLLWNTERL